MRETKIANDDAKIYIEMLEGGRLGEQYYDSQLTTIKQQVSVNAGVKSRMTANLDVYDPIQAKKVSHRSFSVLNPEVEKSSQHLMQKTSNIIYSNKTQFPLISFQIPIAE